MLCLLGTEQRGVLRVAQHPEIPRAAARQDGRAGNPFIMFAVDRECDLVFIEYGDFLNVVSIAWHEREDEAAALGDVKPQQRAAASNPRLALTHLVAVDEQTVILYSECDRIESEVLWCCFEITLAQGGSIERDLDDVDDLRARFMIDEQLERNGVAVVEGLRGGCFGKRSESAVGTRWGEILEKTSAKRFISRQNCDAELLGDRIGVDPQVVTKDDILLSIRQHAMNDPILAGEGLGVEQCGERACRIAAGHFTSESHETAVRELQHELTLRRVLGQGSKAEELNAKQKDPELISHSAILL